MTECLTIGERIAWYRRRRGMSQEVLAGLVGRTVDWLSKVENNRIDLDRLSVIKIVARVLEVSLGDLIAEPTSVDGATGSGRHAVSTLREAVMDYGRISPLLRQQPGGEPPGLTELRDDISDVWESYQQSRYAYMTRRLPSLLAEAQYAADEYGGDAQQQARSLLALANQSAAMVLTKLGETGLAWVTAERGLSAAQGTDDEVVTGSLRRSVAHSLLSTGHYYAAVQLTEDAASYLRPRLTADSPALLSVHGTLLLAGSMAAARAEDRSTSRAFLVEATRLARRLGGDGNYMWTAFGPTNVAIHRVSTAMELGDVQVALDSGPALDTSTLPTERRVRHALEVARAYSAWNRTHEALETLLGAEQLAPEQVHHHVLSRQLVQTWMRDKRGYPTFQLARLARRLGGE